MNKTTIKPTIRTSTSARVTVQIDITVGSWGPDCGLDQVYRQASFEAENRVRRMFEKPGMNVKTVRVEVVTTRTDVK